jgi:putative flippase GtrA
LRATIERLWTGLGADHRALVAQIVRYGVVGLGITIFQISLYNLLVTLLHIGPLGANPLASAAAMLLGYISHSRFTFAGHQAGGVTETGWRFVIVSLIGFALNQGWTWAFTRHFGWPKWSPSLAYLFLTPPVLYLLNRKWVFD